MIGMTTIEQIEEDGNNYALGILETFVSVGDNDFSGSIYDFKLLNTGLEMITDEFGGQLDVSVELLYEGIQESVNGVLTSSQGIV